MTSKIVKISLLKSFFMPSSAQGPAPELDSCMMRNVRNTIERLDVPLIFSQLNKQLNFDMKISTVLLNSYNFIVQHIYTAIFHAITKTFFELTKTITTYRNASVCSSGTQRTYIKSAQIASHFASIFSLIKEYYLKSLPILC